ncbi:MAG TPA: cytochrome c3 family protein [Candidatus Acidoferrales bacterium]|nr:cytochrome c3 family protein [Candidatus Acidoferrales bacterium]
MGKGSAVLDCQSCHTEIAKELSTGHGLHSKFANKEDCAKCHSEHNGEDFALIHWVPSLKEFDHNQTGYPLQGRHAGLACAQCHSAVHVSAAMRPLIRMQDLNKTFLGLSPDCTTCHQDPHHGQLGANCLQCHNFVDWKQATKFDHNTTKYPLTGLHGQVACDKCHAPAVAGGPARFTGIPFAKCNDCHADPHHGAFAQACETCHTTAGWKKIPQSEQFDHSKTKFPLLGKHAQVDCLQCHKQGNFKIPVAFAKCSDCHSPDPHNGQFAERKDKGECDSCHTVDGWKPSLFGMKEHQLAAYPLEGKHAAVACDKCHIPAGAGTRYKIPFQKCTDCHQDAHGGQFAAAPYANRCESCHNVHGFQPSTYTIALHQKTRFPLAGAHLAVTCAECHKTDKSSGSSKIVPYHFSDMTCTGCHQDPHHGEFQSQMAQRRADGRARGCEACHTVKSWTDLPSFDHSKTKFALIGAHRKVACDECHKAEPGQKASEVSFKSAPTTCSGCHEDAHAGQFAAEHRVSNCDSCHNSDHWKPSLFNHETQTDFSLKGAHKDVLCDQCHTGAREVNGKRVIFYRPTPKLCADCHS